jgi:hypothetical protein
MKREYTRNKRKGEGNGLLYSSTVCYQHAACFHNPLSWPRGSPKLDNMDTIDLRVFLYEATGLTASFVP